MGVKAKKILCDAQVEREGTAERTESYEKRFCLFTATAQSLVKLDGSLYFAEAIVDFRHLG